MRKSLPFYRNNSTKRTWFRRITEHPFIDPPRWDSFFIVESLNYLQKPWSADRQKRNDDYTIHFWLTESLSKFFFFMTKLNFSFLILTTLRSVSTIISLDFLQTKNDRWRCTMHRYRFHGSLSKPISRDWRSRITEDDEERSFAWIMLSIRAIIVELRSTGNVLNTRFRFIVCRFE